MYLTRIKLDTAKRATMRGLTNPSLLHGALESSFSGERQHPLWRLDRLHGATYLLLLSHDQPDLTHAAEEFGFPELGWESRDYTPVLQRISRDTLWQFRLVANPTKSVPDPKVEGRGRVCAHTVPKYQKQWLREQGEKHGFQVTEESFEVKGEQWFHFLKGNERKAAVSLLAVTYEGVLRVTDPERFCETLCHGLGRGKAYGMGLLTVVAYHE
jgi:CRISPR system Cascade subunit CasE